MLGLVGKVVVNSEDIKQTEKLQEWLDSLPEIVREKEPANVDADNIWLQVVCSCLFN